MKAKKTLVFGLLALTAVSSRAENDGRANCSNWNLMDDSFRLGYMVGFAGGTAAAYTEVGPPAVALARINADPYTAPQLTNREHKDGITSICKLPENALLPIPVALRAFVMQVKGWPQSEINAYLAAVRLAAIGRQDSDKQNK